MILDVALACFGFARKGQSIWQVRRYRLNASTKEVAVIPDTLKILLVLGLIAGAAYGSVWGLATFPPEQAEVLKALPHDKLRQN
jgi:hypothetical protein